jgi:CelD/BcsL family acetyltransferase involved in cellulose biosynthesis
MTAHCGLALPGTPAAPQRRSQPRVAVLRSARALREHLGDWEDLVANAVEENPFYEPWMLLPALEAAPGAEAASELVLVHAGDRLIGLFPLERRPHFKGLPLRELRLWRHALCFLCTPLLRRGCERECLDGFFRWLELESGASLLRLHHVSGEGPFHHALIQHFERHPQRVHATDRYTRALFRPRPSAAGYLRAALPGRKLKEFRRLWRRLAERGTLAVRALDPAERAERWIGAFLELEARGWKGRAGTALDSTPASRAHFEGIALEAHRRARLVMHSLTLEGRPIAMSCKFLAGDGAFAYKIAHDEIYEQYSPGTLLELECIVRMHGEARVGWMDSCAVPEHFMANQLWPDRRALETVTVAAGGAGGVVVLLLPLLRWARRRLARAA